MESPLARKNFVALSQFMGKQVFIIKGSPRKQGNTSLMADAFAQGGGKRSRKYSQRSFSERKEDRGLSRLRGLSGKRRKLGIEVGSR